MLEWLHDTATVSGDSVDNRVLSPEFEKSDFFQLRSNTKCYKVFFDRFAPIVERKLGWGNKMAKAEADKDMLSISSEAFGLLLVENMWDRWIDIYQLTNGGVAKGRRTASMKGINSKVLPLYTCGGVHVNRDEKDDDVNAGHGVSCTMKGWNALGIKRFNELYDVVAYDWKAYPGFFKEWIKSARSTMDKVETKGEYEKKRNDAYGRWNLEDNEEDGIQNDQNLQKVRRINKCVEVEKAQKAVEMDAVGSDEDDPERGEEDTEAQDEDEEREADDEAEEDDGANNDGNDDDDGDNVDGGAEDDEVEDEEEEEEKDDEGEEHDKVEDVGKGHPQNTKASKSKKVTVREAPKVVKKAKKVKKRMGADKSLSQSASPRKTTRSTGRRR